MDWNRNTKRESEKEHKENYFYYNLQLIILILLLYYLKYIQSNPTILDKFTLQSHTK